MSGLEIRNISKAFGYLKVLNNISRHFPAGTIHLVSGRNGIGKSTLLNVISTAESPDEGIVLYDSVPVRDHRVLFLRRTGYLSSSLYMIDQLTVRENIRLFAGIRNLKLEEEKIRNSCAYWGLNLDSPCSFSRLSTGTRKKVALMMLFLTEPEIYLMDEPYSGLDIESVKKLDSLISAEMTKGKTIILTSHQFPDFPEENLSVFDMPGQTHQS